MELLGILIAIVFGIPVAILYCYTVNWLIKPINSLSRLAVFFSLVVVAVFILTMVPILALGPLEARQYFGLTIAVPFSVSVLLTAPATANLLVLAANPNSWLGSRFTSVTASFVVGICSIFLNISVSEAWYGIDGIGGPYL